MRSIYIGTVIVLAVFGLVAWQFDTTTPAEPAHVETMIAEKTEIALPPAGPSKGVTEPVKPQNMRELQQQYDNYYTLALELLQRARAGNGESQYELANLISFCRIAVDLDRKMPNLTDKAMQLSAFKLSDAELTMLNHAISERTKCAEFANLGFDHFNDEFKTNTAQMSLESYWFNRAFQNGIDAAAILVLGQHIAGERTLSTNELQQAKAMLKRSIAKPNYLFMDRLATLFNTKPKHMFMPEVIFRLQQEPDFFAPSEGMFFDLQASFIQGCLAKKYLNDSKPFEKDCAEDVQRYGFPSHNNGPEIEAETAKFIQAWKKGDYDAIGFEGLAQYLDEQ